MSVECKKDDSNQSPSYLKFKESVASHHALQIALLTIKERCQKLQQRLASVEEENLRLKIEKTKFNDDIQSQDTSSARAIQEINPESQDEKIAQLSRQKSQLTHHLFMVATENRHLWSRLSLLTKANQSLGSHLSKISGTLSRHNSGSNLGVQRISESQILPVLECTSPTTISKRDSGDLNVDKETLTSVQLSEHKLSTFSPTKLSEGLELQTLKFSRGGDSYQDVKEESLEEISSKLIKSILQEKSELENQYAEMVELQSGASSFNVPNLGFGYLEDEDDTSIEEMAQHCDKLQVLKESLKTQQVMLRNAVNSLSKATIGEMTCKQCKEHLKVDSCSSSKQKVPESPRRWGMAHPTTYNEKIQRQLNQVAEPPTADGMEEFNTQRTPPYKPDLVPNICRMCPLCGKMYYATSTFEEFNEHVQSHFGEEDEEIDSFNNFEIINH